MLGILRFMPPRLRRRFALMQVLALLLPIVGMCIFLLLPTVDSFSGIAEVCFSFVLLGSMTLTIWVASRRSTVWATGAMPEPFMAAQVVLWALALVWLALVTATHLLQIGWVQEGIGGSNSPDTELLRMMSPVFAIAIAVAASFAFVLAFKRAPDPASVPLPWSRASSIRWIAIGYLVAVAVTAVLAVTSFFVPLLPLQVWVVFAIVLGLPWSHPVVTAIAFYLLFFGFLGGSSLSGGEGVMVPLGVVPVVVNVVFAILLLRSPTRRDRMVRAFFRLDAAPGSTAHDVTSEQAPKLAHSGADGPSDPSVHPGAVGSGAPPFPTR